MEEVLKEKGEEKEEDNCFQRKEREKGQEMSIKII
jgi:hypothetical protein